MEIEGLIEQRAAKDCFLCCLAMATGVDYDARHSVWGNEFVQRVSTSGMYGRDIWSAFAAIGYEPNRDYLSMLCMEGTAAQQVKNLLWGRRAIVQVPSKNYLGESHIVYWNGSRLFDPSPLATYEWDGVKPEHLWLLRSTRSPVHLDNEVVEAAEAAWFANTHLGWRKATEAVLRTYLTALQAQP